MNTFELIIFILLVLFNTFLLFMWLYKKREYRGGEFYDSSEVVALYTLPRVIFTLYIIFLIFYIADFNKLHLLYICPIIYFIISCMMAGRVIKEEKKF